MGTDWGLVSGADVGAGASTGARTMNDVRVQLAIPLSTTSRTTKPNSEEET